MRKCFTSEEADLCGYYCEQSESGIDHVLRLLQLFLVGQSECELHHTTLSLRKDTTSIGDLYIFEGVFGRCLSNSKK